MGEVGTVGEKVVEEGERFGRCRNCVTVGSEEMVEESSLKGKMC